MGLISKRWDADQGPQKIKSKAAGEAKAQDVRHECISLCVRREEKKRSKGVGEDQKVYPQSRLAGTAQL